MQNENLGPAERIINALLAYQDHMVHNRPGVVTPDRSNVGAKWQAATYKTENGERVVYLKTPAGPKKSKLTRIGVLRDPNSVVENGRNIGTYRRPGIFPEVAVYMYRQVAEVWKLDNEFSARWASYVFGQNHKDMKVVLAAFMLVQSRKGDPVVDNGKVEFFDEDYRDVGEAMMLSYSKAQKGLDPKQLLRIHSLLTMPQIAEINRELGFGKSARSPFLGRWPRAVEKYLRYREENPKLLESMVKDGWRTSLIELAKHVGYKPSTPKFFQILRWKQKQSDAGHRQILIGAEVAAAESWEGLDEATICQKIVKEKIGYKRIAGLLPKKIGLTRAIMAAAIEAGSLSDKDLVIATPTLEELGLLQVQDIRERWERAVKASEDMRAANIARNVKSKAVKETLDSGADAAVQKAVEEVVRGLMVHVIVDVSGSMQGAIEKAKEYISKFLQGFPKEKLKVSVFNTVGREIKIPSASAAGVQNAFRGIVASGGTHYSGGVRTLAQYKPAEGEDLLMIFVGDEEDSHPTFAPTIREAGLNPMAFGLIRVMGTQSHGRGRTVQQTAADLGIPCFQIEENTFADPYAIPRTVRALVAATPVGKAVTQGGMKRETLIDTILKTELLRKPAWAA